MTSASEIGYLVHICLIERGFTESYRTIKGFEIVDTLKKDAPDYITAIGQLQFDKYLTTALELATDGSVSDNIRDLETSRIASLTKQPWTSNTEQGLLNTPPHLRNSYWVQNGAQKGWIFWNGITPKQIRRESSCSTLPVIISLSQVISDETCWGYINTWLERNWRLRVPVEEHSRA